MRGFAGWWKGRMKDGSFFMVFLKNQNVTDVGCASFSFSFTHKLMFHVFHIFTFSLSQPTVHTFFCSSDISVSSCNFCAEGLVQIFITSWEHVSSSCSVQWKDKQYNIWKHTKWTPRLIWTAGFLTHLLESNFADRAEGTWQTWPTWKKTSQIVSNPHH